MTARKRPLRHYLRSLYAWHRWLGIVSAVFVLHLAATGFALNHTEAWKLGKLSAPVWLRALYGIEVPAPTVGLAFDGHWFTAHDGWLYYDAQPVTAANHVIGVLRVFDSYVVGTETGFLSVAGADSKHAQAGRLIERITYGAVPGTPLALSENERAVYLQTTAGMFSALYRENDLQWFPVETDQAPAALQAQSLPAAIAQAIQHDAAQRALSWERVLLDLHSGRLLGAYGVLVMDAVVLMFMVLALTGLILWLRYTLRQRRRRSRRLGSR